MDVFEEKIKELSELSPKERKKETDKLAMDCICNKCPSYNQCAVDKEEWLFCFTGSSDGCIELEKGCLCPQCPFGKKYTIGTEFNFYCMRGSEIEQHNF